MASEQLIDQWKPQPVRVIWAFLVVMVSLGALLAYSVLVPKLNVAWLWQVETIVAGIVVVGTCAFLVWRMIEWASVSYTLTADRLSIKSGLLSSRRHDVLLSRISQVTIRQNLWGRMTKSGQIHLTTVDGTQFGLIYVPNVRRLHNFFAEEVEKNRTRARIGLLEASIRASQQELLRLRGMGGHRQG